MSAARLARYKDPVTSHQAAEVAIESGAIARQAADVLEMVRSHPGLTFEELGKLGGEHLDKYAVARRLPALVEAGLVHPGDEKKTSSGRLARTWWSVRGPSSEFRVPSDEGARQEALRL